MITNRDAIDDQGAKTFGQNHSLEFPKYFRSSNSDRRLEMNDGRVNNFFTGRHHHEGPIDGMRNL